MMCRFVRGIKEGGYIHIPYLRRKIGIVFQDFQLLSDRNVEKNLSFVLGATGWTDPVEISKRIDEVHIILSVAHGPVASGCCGHSAPTVTHGVLPFK